MSWRACGCAVDQASFEVRGLVARNELQPHHGAEKCAVCNATKSSIEVNHQAVGRDRVYQGFIGFAMCLLNKHDGGGIRRNFLGIQKSSTVTYWGRDLSP